MVEVDSPESNDDESLWTKLEVPRSLASVEFHDAIAYLQNLFDNAERSFYIALRDKCGATWPFPGEVPYSRLMSLSRMLNELEGYGYVLIADHPIEAEYNWYCEAVKGNEDPDPLRATGYCQVSTMSLLLAAARSREGTRRKILQV